ncbi:MAG: hypothetical protein H0W81_04960 [Chloroflexi bacterium]|nr:hypothetical protein [Chloroflexota bacterium]
MDSNVVTYSPIRLGVEPSLAPRLSELAHGRSIVVDYFASRTRRGVTVGDLRARFSSAPPGSDYAELEPLGDVRVLAERHLLQLLAARTELRLGGPAFARHLMVVIERPERWLEFLEAHPGNRR